MNNADTHRQYETARTHGGFRRTDQRGLIAVTGRDRLAWLHNLTTNVVKTLRPGDGNYAFAITVQGRTLFDLNILVFEDRVWLDVDRRWVGPALAHLSRYIIVEDVQLADLSSDWTRFEVLGRRAAECVHGLGLAGNFGAFASLQHVTGSVGALDVVMFKDNLGPIVRAVLLAPSASAGTIDELLLEHARRLGMDRLSDAVCEIVRIEAGRPASVEDIDEQVIPPETLQVERGISYVKGCYLGQEVIERMRSRGSMARRLVGLHVDCEQIPEHNAPVFAGGKEAGRVTSACRSPALGGVLALGYLKTLLVSPEQALQVAVSAQSTAPARIVPLPLPAWT